MSIQGDAGAESAAEEIADFVRKKIEERAAEPESVAVLREVEVFAEGIAKTANAGWY